MNSSAAKSRESAREADGKFGHQEHDRADGIELADMASEAEGLLAPVEALPYPVDDLSPWHQEQTELPASFEEAYREHFQDSHREVGMDDGDFIVARARLFEERDARLAAAAKRLRLGDRLRANSPTDEQAGEWRAAEHEGWHVSQLGDRSATLVRTIHIPGGDWDRGYFREIDSKQVRSPAALDLLRAAQHADVTAQRVRQLEAIVEEGVAPWSFLPATHRQQQRAENVASQHAREIHQLSRDLGKRRIAEQALSGYEGMDDAQVEVAYWEGLERTDRAARGGQVATFWYHRSVDEPRSYDLMNREMVEDFAAARVVGVRKGREELAAMPGDAKQEERRLAELQDTVEYYRRSQGWPGGDMSPQEYRGSWHRFVAADKVEVRGARLDAGRFEEIK